MAPRRRDGPGGDDPSCRPNQVLAISLPNPVRERARRERVLAVVEERLLTPVGLRSLSRSPGVEGQEPPDDRAGARRILHGLVAHGATRGFGRISEAFDAEPPFTPRGCAAQAWGVAEALRALLAISTPGP